MAGLVAEHAAQWLHSCWSHIDEVTFATDFEGDMPLTLHTMSCIG